MATYTEERKAEAVALALDVGPTEAGERLGIPKSTISSWFAPEQRAELAARSTAKTAAATATRTAHLEQRRLDLAESLMADAERLRLQLFAPCVERKAMIVSLGREAGSEIQVVNIDRDQPTFRDQQTIATTLAIAVDKVQVLTGQATERIEVTGDARTRALELADELAERRERKGQAA